MNYTLIGITGENLNEVYSARIGKTPYSLVGPYLSTGNFVSSLSGTNGTFFTKINSGAGWHDLSLFILAPPIHRNGEKLLLISNDQILDLGPQKFASVSPVISDVFPNPEVIGKSITIAGENLLGVDRVIFGNAVNGTAGTEAFSPSFSFSEDGSFINDCIIPEDAGSGFLKVVNFNDLTGTSPVPFYPFPRIDSLDINGPFTGVVGQSVGIIGKSFNHVTGVRFGSVLSKSFTIDSNYRLTAVVPSGKVNGKISVSGYTGTFDISTFDFEVIPIITGQSPPTGKRGSTTSLLATGVFPEILFAALTGVGINTGYLISFQGFKATGLFFIDGPNLTGLVPAKAKQGIVGVVRDATLSTYPSDYLFKLSGISPVLTSLESEFGFTGTLGFTAGGADLDVVTGLALKHISTNYIYDLPTGVAIERGFYLRQNTTEGQDLTNAFSIRVNGLSGEFPERTTLSQKALQEGEYRLLMTDANGASTLDTDVVFYFATKPSITGFLPTSGFLTSVINVFGTGLYNRTRARFDAGGGKRVDLTLNVGNVGGSYDQNRTLSFPLRENQNLREVLFNEADPPRESITGFLYFDNEFYPEDYSTGNASGIVPYTIFAPPYVSGFTPQIGSVGDLISLSGLGFKEVQTVKLSRGNFSVPNFNVIGTTGINFLITDNIFQNSKGGGHIEINASGGRFITNLELLLLSSVPEGRKFIPQPASVQTLATLTGKHLRGVNTLNFTGINDTIVTLTLGDRLTSDTFVTGSGKFNTEGPQEGVYLEFKSPYDVVNNNFVELVTFDGLNVRSDTVFKNANETIFYISGFSGLPEIFSGVVGDVFGISGSGFTTSNAKIIFGTGKPTEPKFQLMTSQGVVNDRFMTGKIEPGMNGILGLSGATAIDTQVESVPGFRLFAQISGVRSLTMTEDDVFVVSGINNFIFSESNATGAQNESERRAPLIRLAITGIRYGSAIPEVEFINYTVSGFQIKNGNAIFSGRLNSEFAGTGRLFLINLDDAGCLGTEDDIRNAELPYPETPDESSAELLAELGPRTVFNNFDPDATPGYTLLSIPKILASFNKTVTINEKQATIRDFSPKRGQKLSSVVVSGASVRAITGVALFSGATQSESSVPFSYVSFFKSGVKIGTTDFFPTPEDGGFELNYGNVSFNVPENYSESSGRFRFMSKNFTTDSINFFKVLRSASAGAIVPTEGVAGDLITLNGQNFSSAEGVKFVDLDGEFATGAFSIIDDNKITVTVPNEGRLPAPQVVSIRVVDSFSIGDTILGNFEVRQGSEKFFGNIEATGYISGLNFSGSGPRGRPTVGGIEVLLVGEGGGGGGGINITGGIDTDSASEIFTGNGTQSLFGLNSGIHTGIKGSTQQIRSASVLVSIDGLIQNPVEHYTIVDPLGGVKFSGLQFASVPFSGSDIEVRRFGDTVTIEIVAVDQAIIYALVLG